MDLQDGDLKCTVDAPVPEVRKGNHEKSDGDFLLKWKGGFSDFCWLLSIFLFQLYGEVGMFFVVVHFGFNFWGVLDSVNGFDMRVSCR